MRLITWRRLEQWGDEYPDVRTWLAAWGVAALVADWGSLDDVRTVYPHADEVVVESRKPVTIFNVKGNRYRMISAIHYNTACVYTMRFMTHAEYCKDRWKGTL